VTQIAQALRYSRLPWPLGPTAHRGLHDITKGRVENSAGAIGAAVNAGLAIEIDLQCSGDGVAMVFHDTTLDRLLDAEGLIRLRDAAALRRLTYRGGGDAVLTLSEAFEIVGGRVPVYVEFKSGFDGDRALERAAAPVLADYAGPVAVMSFDPHSVAACAELLPDVPRGLVSGSYATPEWETGGSEAAAPWRRIWLRHCLAAKALGVSFLNHEVGDLARPSIQRLRHARGLPVLAWTVRSEDDWAHVARYADAAVFEGAWPAAPVAV